MFLGSPTRTVDVDGVAVVGESVEDGCGCDVVAQVVSPFIPLDVGRDDTRPSTVISGGDDLVEEAGIVRLVDFALGSVESDFVDADCFAKPRGPVVVPAKTFLSQLL